MDYALRDKLRTYAHRRGHGPIEQDRHRNGRKGAPCVGASVPPQQCARSASTHRSKVNGKRAMREGADIRRSGQRVHTGLSQGRGGIERWGRRIRRCIIKKSW
eukprot:scaffold61986_cov35-Tisochrysis_lutea.AAC.2